MVAYYPTNRNGPHSRHTDPEPAPEGWTEAQEAEWRQLTAEVDTTDYLEYLAAGGLRSFADWRSSACTTCLARHHSLTNRAELEHWPSGPVGPVEWPRDVIDLDNYGGGDDGR